MPKDLSCADLEELMIWHLTGRGKSPDFVAGYIDAQRRAGWLRPAAPAWLRNSAGVFYAIPLPPPPCHQEPKPT